VYRDGSKAVEKKKSYIKMSQFDYTGVEDDENDDNEGIHVSAVYESINDRESYNTVIDDDQRPQT
jgi:hypothetical protein